STSMEESSCSRSAPAAHDSGLFGRRRSEMIRCWIWLVPSKIVVSRASRQLPFHLPFRGVAVAAVELDPVAGHLHRHLGGQQLDHGRLALAGLALVDEVGHLAVVGPGLVD